MRFLLICLSLLIFSPHLHAQKKHVCSITINSSDEINYLKKALNPNFYEFKELVPDDRQAYVLNWFDKACEMNYRCDILVISGHFGGEFFGDSPYILTLQNMFKKSCDNSCPNILSAPQEVYLFGCNTLATKATGNDGRTFESYYQVLLDHGYPNDLAFKIATTRFSPLASTFSNQMKQIFKGNDKQIFGFSFISPLGPTNARIMNSAAKSSHAHFESAEFTDTLLRKYHEQKIEFTRISGNSTNEELGFYNKVCAMEDRNSELSLKFERINELLSSDRYMEALPSSLFILNSFKDLNSKQFSPEEATALEGIQRNPLIKERLFSIIKSLNKTPDMQVEIYKLIYSLGWMGRSEFTSKIRNLLMSLAQVHSQIKMDYLCNIKTKNPDFFNTREFLTTPIELKCDDYLNTPQYYSPSQFFGGVKNWKPFDYIEENKKDLILLNSFYHTRDEGSLQKISDFLNFTRSPFGRAEDVSYLISLLAYRNFLDKDKLERLSRLVESSSIDSYHLYAIQINRTFTREEVNLLSEIPLNPQLSPWTKAYFFVILLANNKDLSDEQLQIWLNSLQGEPEIYKSLKEFLMKEYRSSPAIRGFLQ
ncbi:MAG: hypothetical protein ACXVB4_18575 [Pseudobdellovibrionaceae bacterium]